MNHELLKGMLANFPGKGILVVGDTMLDEYVWGDVRRISPEAPVPLVEIQRRTYVPGGAANVAANVAALGGRPILLSVVGNDPQAELLRQALGQNDISPDEGLLVDASRPTTIKTRILAHNQQMIRLDGEQRRPLSPAMEQQVLGVVESKLPEVNACIISDYAKGVVTPRVSREVVRLARRAGVPVVVDPKGTDFSKYSGATLVKPNLLEAGHCVNAEITSEASLLEVGRKLVHLLEGAALLITRGAEGMSLFQKDVPPVHIPAVLRRVFDVTGAGDTVATTLAMSLAAQGTLEQAVHLANHAASIVVGKVGTATATREELLAELSGWGRS